MISSRTEHTPKEFSRMLSQRKNVNSFYMYSYAEHTGKWFYRTLSIRGNDFNAGWAYEEMISSLTEHTRKCLKVEYLGRIEYNFQKSRVTGPWDHKDLVSAKKCIKNFHVCVPLILWGYGLSKIHFLHEFNYIELNNFGITRTNSLASPTKITYFTYYYLEFATTS